MIKMLIRTEDLRLLREILEIRAPGRVRELLALVLAGTLTHADRAQLCELIGAEFAATGLGADSEPTQRGRRLEDLLDTINRPNTKGE